MHSSKLTILLSLTALTSALPFFGKRVVASLDQAAFEEAQQRDATATRALSAVEIKTSTGQCLFINQFSGDFRANLNPIQVGKCDGSTGQKWDVITKGKHNNVAGTALIVNVLTQACMNFDPRRAAGNQVIMFSCGGRADGSGQVTDSQLFPFTATAGAKILTPKNAVGTCFTVKGAVIDQAACVAGSSTQAFTFGGAAAAPSSTKPVVSTKAATPSIPACAVAPPAASSTPPKATTSAAPPKSTTSASAAPPKTTSSTSAAAPPKSTTSAVAPPATTSQPAATSPPAATSVPAAGTLLQAQPTAAIPVSRARGVLDPTGVAQSMQRDDTAVRAVSGAPLKSGADGLCLTIDLTAGDFRENLIPVALKPCDGTPSQAFDIITSGKHNNVAGSALVVSALTQGCLNFDDRRAAGDQVILFSCGGRADGDGATTNSQLFPFKAGAKTILLAPLQSNGAVCLVPKAALLDQTTCSGAADQLFTIG